MRVRTLLLLMLSACLLALSLSPGAQAKNYRLRFGGDFTLTDHNGAAFSLDDARGKVVLIYFGYTSCADVCPLALAKVGMAMRGLGLESKNVQPLFISVDTKRDTPELLRSYATYFHPAILGLTGTQDEVEAVARQYRAPVYIRRSDENGFYPVDHSAKLYLVARDGVLANILPDASPPEKITDEIRDLLRN